MTRSMTVTLATVSTAADVRSSAARFAADCAAFAKDPLIESLIRRTRYIVFDPRTGEFAPSKWAGFVGMDLARYAAARDNQSQGAAFDGTVAQRAIATAVGPWQSDKALSLRFAAWAEQRWGAAILTGVDRSKWQFVTLPNAAGGLMAVAGGWEGSDELVEITLSIRRTSGRKGPSLD